MDKRINSLERKLRFQSVVIALLGMVTTCLLVESLQLNSDPSIIYTEGIVIQDQQGKARMAMGFPIDNKLRKRADELSGLLILDEHGMDRVHLGPHGDLFLGGNYHPRLNRGYSLFFNDSLGEERSGYGFSDDDNSVGLGMDYGGELGGEAIYLYAAPNIAFMTINADLQGERGVRDRIVLWHETDKDLSLVKLSDRQKDGRIRLKTEKGAVLTTP